LVDSLLKKLKNEGRGKVEPHDIVDKATKELLTLRQYRAGLIQTPDQLDFSMKAIKHLHNRNIENKNNPLVNEMEIDQGETGQGETGQAETPEPAAATEATPQPCKRRTPAPTPPPSPPVEKQPPAEPVQVKVYDEDVPSDEDGPTDEEPGPSDKGDGPHLDIDQKGDTISTISDEKIKVIL
jgi:hypothetical protein